jgi:ribose transport system substrate-binding protein
MRVGKRAAALLVAGAVAVGALGVMAATAGAAKTQAATDGVKIGYISLGETVPFVRLVTKNIQDVARRRGAELVFCDSQLDAQKAIDCARQFKTQGVQGIINFQVDESAAPRVCQAGPDVPVVAIDIFQKPCERVFYGADNANAGKFAGRALGAYAKSKFNCNVDALLVLDQRSAGKVVVDRLNGMVQGFKQYCRNVDDQRVNYKGTTDSAIQPIRDTLSRLPGKRIFVVSVNDDGVIGAIKGAEQIRRSNDLYVAGQGADPTSFPYMCGKNRFKNWIADTAYFPERYGNFVVPILLNLIAGKSQPKVVYVKHQAVTQKNIRKLYPNACK